MKQFFKYILVALAVPVLFTSCLKDDELLGPDADGAVKNIIEFGNIDFISSSTSSPYPVYIKSIDLEPSIDLIVPVKIVGVYNPSADIKVTVEVDNSILTKYNEVEAEDEDEEITPLPASKYQVESYEVVIPKGQKSADLKIKLFGDQFDFNATYGIALRIKSISEGVISGNFGSIIISTVPKNEYDGIYSSEDGYVQRYSAPGSPTVNDALNGSMKGNPDVTLSSIDANTVEISNLKWAGGSSGIAGVDNLRFRVDPATNEVTVFALGNTSAKNMPGTVNKYDPATKTFTLNFHWNPTSTVREVTNLVLKYKEPR